MLIAVDDASPMPGQNARRASATRNNASKFRILHKRCGLRTFRPKTTPHVLFGNTLNQLASRARQTGINNPFNGLMPLEHACSR